MSLARKIIRKVFKRFPLPLSLFNSNSLIDNLGEINRDKKKDFFFFEFFFQSEENLSVESKLDNRCHPLANPSLIIKFADK